MQLVKSRRSFNCCHKKLAAGKKQRGNRGFTLAEMIMAVAMLAFFSVFIVQMFAKADQISRQTNCLDQAVLIASDWADEWKRASQYGLSPEIEALMEQKEAGAWVESYLNQDFKPCAPDQASYTAILSLSRTENDEQVEIAHLWILSIEIFHGPDADQAPLYALDVARYFPEGG